MTTHGVCAGCGHEAAGNVNWYPGWRCQACADGIPTVQQIAGIPNAITPVAVGGKVELRLRLYGPDLSKITLTPEQADAFWNQVAEAELVALEQRVAARRRVTEGARGGWATAPAAGRHAFQPPQNEAEARARGYWIATDGTPDAGMALAESTAAALARLAVPGDCTGLPGCPVHRTRTHAGHAAPGPGDPYPAPDYQHPDDDDD